MNKDKELRYEIIKTKTIQAFATDEKYNTNWSTATTSLIKALRDIISCSQYGSRCWLWRYKNTDKKVTNPILMLNPLLDDKENWTFSYGTTRNQAELLKRQYLNETERELTLYYEYDWKNGAIKKLENTEESWVTFWTPKDGIKVWIPKPLRRKVWVVVYSDEKKPSPLWVRLLIFLNKPFRYIPKHSVLKMDGYTIHTFRIGDVTHGYSIEFQIPKKFRFGI